MCDIYYGVMLRDIYFTFSMNLEQHLWKQAFYKPIEVFKSVVNSPKDSSRTFRAHLLLMLNRGITFYDRLLALYEKELHVDLEKAMLFPFDREENFWDVCLSPKSADAESSKRKTALKSCSRHLISLGDLKRYRTLIEGSEDYSGSRAAAVKEEVKERRVVLAKAEEAGLSISNARRNIANFKTKGHALDEIYFCVRALSAGHPFEAARDRLYARLAAMKRKLHRRTISYVINTVGLLITKIGMESFPSVSERAIGQLAALVEQELSPVTPAQLVQISALFIYAVHCNGIVGDEDVCSVQQQQAVRALVSVFGVLLRPLALRLDDVRSWTKGTADVPRTVARVLPALCVLCEWFSCPLASAIYRTMPSVEPLSMSIISVDTWHLLAKIANTLAQLQDGGELVKIENSSVSSSACILPELAYLSSFSSVFPSSPRVLRYSSTSEDLTEKLVPLQIRLAQLLLAAEYLDGSELSCFFFCEKSGRFTRSEYVEGDLSEHSKASTAQQNEDLPRVSTPLTREELLERELRKHEQLLVVGIL
ncbi:unnamed protein product [Heligmosomoides polygyrus]|uniref:Uncharacterized protein n=1 Tax=Heligmosomoides polygyrus TaxID=6339 RepID=A0A3P7ZN93_HELPZ|nr:unnamed protein product [Heligmosomoides polygyrus]